ncbi:MAG: glycosyltransferase family A protein [Candidatus Kapabacteria bacterium]|jgi:glycosyltransferase involved in cell wall biosynthesis|nr:glycosyltransferase family A protein [Candidatus Kapabacteria bacterium]
MICVNKDRIPFFSIIIAAFNRAGILPRAIDSVLKQTEDDYELIIVDDGSTDDTVNLIRKYWKKNDKIKYIRQSRQSIGMAKNSGVLASSGIWITFLDPYDELEPNHLAVRRETLLSNPEVELVHGGIKVIGDNYSLDPNNPGEEMHIDQCVIGGTFFFRKEIAEKVGGFPPMDYGEDVEFFNKIWKRNMIIGKLENPTYIYHRD